MKSYDFNSLLSPIDFELLCKDLLEADLGIRLENFREGKDKGIDLRFAPVHRVYGIAELRNTLVFHHAPALIVQCKRYSKFSDLKSEIKTNELSKIEALKPARYILTTSVSLSPAQTDELKELMSPYVLSTGDIYGRDRLNALLEKHSEVERRHVKLWIGSAGVLESIINAGVHMVSREELERTVASAKIYVRNKSFDEAVEILKRHRVCIIAGLPGIGKTTLARMLLLFFYENEFDVVKIEGDISEARGVGYHNRPRFYYYDDFLGQTGQADKLNKNEDQKILDFMTSVRDSKDSVFVLTTREYILNQAKLQYEKFDREKFDHKTCVVDLTKYSRRIRAQIVYNHLHFSDLPRAYIRELVSNRGYLKVVDHRNYNPRLIEFLTDKTWLGDISASEYLPLFLRKLDNPVEIWNHAFRNQLSDAARNVLFVLATMPVMAPMPSTELAFCNFHNSFCLRGGIPRRNTDFKNALKELDGTFIGMIRTESVMAVTFKNPSIRDFMKHLLLDGEQIQETLSSLTYFDQAAWFAETLKEASSQAFSSVSLSFSASVADAMQALFDSPSCHDSAQGKAFSEEIRIRRFAQLAQFAIHRGISTPTPFMDTQVARIVGLLNEERLLVADVAEAAEVLRKLGYIAGNHELKLLDTLRLVTNDKPQDIDEFERLVETIVAFPELFEEKRLQAIRDEYAYFIEQFVIDYKKGTFDIDDPEVIREDASRVDQIGEALEVDTKKWSAAITDIAHDIEIEQEERREWRDRGDSHSTSGAQEICPDSDLDSMFGTLES